MALFYLLNLLQRFASTDTTNRAKFYPTDHCGVLRIKYEHIEPKFVAWVLNNEGQYQGFKRNYSASVDRIKALSISLPSFDIQKDCISKIEKIESKKDIAQKTLTNIPERKKSVIKKYLYA